MAEEKQIGVKPSIEVYFFLISSGGGVGGTERGQLYSIYSLTRLLPPFLLHLLLSSPSLCLNNSGLLDVLSQVSLTCLKCAGVRVCD